VGAISVLQTAILLKLGTVVLGMKNLQSERNTVNIIFVFRYSLRVNLRQQSKTEKSKTPKTQHDRYKTWYEKLKKNKVAYEQHKKKDSIKQKLYRQSLSGNKKLDYNNKSKLRMREYRSRRKERGEVNSTPATRRQVEKKREYWREKKKQQRAKMAPQAKLRENEKRKERYRMMVRKKLQFQGTPTKDAIKRASGRMAIPKNPAMFAATVDSLVNEATSKKREALKARGLVFTPKSKRQHATHRKIVANMKTELKKLKTDRTKDARKKYHWLTQSIVGKHAVERRLTKELDIKWDYWQQISFLQEEHVPRVDAMSDETKGHIKRFYATESVTLPNKRSVSLKSGKQKAVMTETLQQSHVKFRREHPGEKVSLSTFRKHRPKEVLCVNKQKFITCLCEYCLNVQYKMATINKLCTDRNLQHLKLENEFDCVEKSLCEK